MQMPPLPDLPVALLQQLLTQHGKLLSIERLGGKSGALVSRLRFAQTSLIAKQSNHPTELHFYQRAAPILRAHNIPLPALEASLSDSSSHWLILENIPQPLPRDRWYGDAELFSILVRLHTLPIDLIPSDRAGYVPGWSPELSEMALAQFPPATAAQLRHVLEPLRQQAQPLFIPECWISADPNPMNWGIRADGSLVLFDWERFTRAAPAIDLAIIVAGLSARAQFQSVAQAYLARRPGYPVSADQLSSHIILAKLWAIVEFLSEYTTGHLQPDATLHWLIEQVPAWLASLDLT